MSRDKITITFEKGGAGSGHYGHAGRPGKRGGSLPSGVALSIRTGRDRASRQRLATTTAAKDKNKALLNSMRNDPIVKFGTYAEGQGVSDTYSGKLPDGTRVHVKTKSVYGETRAEADVYEITQMLGDEYTDLVPPTVLREDGSSVQLWVDGYVQAGSFNIGATDRGFIPEENNFVPEIATNADAWSRMTAMDIVFGNTDRHLGNFMIGKDGKGLKAIDNDQMFVGYEQLKFGDVLYDITFAEEQFYDMTGKFTNLGRTDFQPFIDLAQTDQFQKLLSNYSQIYQDSVYKRIDDIDNLRILG